MIDEEFHNPDKYQLWMLVDLKNFKSFCLNKEICFFLIPELSLRNANAKPIPA
jgi:hypothetical protein